METLAPISLQINLAPVDYPYAQHVLRHQIDALGGLMDEILLVVDLHQSVGRFKGEHWEDNKSKLFGLIDNLKEKYPQIQTLPVDYSVNKNKQLANFFFKDPTLSVPQKDHRGGPYYAYYFGLFETKNDWIFHLDADIMLCQSNIQWFVSAIELLQSNPHYLSCNPLSSPPKKDSASFKNALEWSFANDGNDFTTRHFFVNKERLRNKIPRDYPNIDHIIKALLKGNPPFRVPEGCIKHYMKDKGLRRMEFLGSDNTHSGFWTIHPPERDEKFYRALPNLIRCVESNRYPDVQAGNWDVTQEYLDFAINN